MRAMDHRVREKRARGNEHGGCPTVGEIFRVPCPRDSEQREDRQRAGLRSQERVSQGCSCKLSLQHEQDRRRRSQRTCAQRAQGGTDISCRSVSESFPLASVAATTPDAGSDPKKLAMGQFKGYAHEAQGNADGLTVVSSFASGAASLGKPARRPPGHPCRTLRFLLSHPSAMGYLSCLHKQVSYPAFQRPETAPGGPL